MFFKVFSASLLHEQISIRNPAGNQGIQLAGFVLLAGAEKSYLRSLNRSKIAITSGCVGVNFIPRFNIPITFLAFFSISLAVFSLVNIK